MEEPFIQIPMRVFDVLFQVQLGVHERAVFDFIARKTWGFQKESDWISHSQFERNTHIDRRRVGRALRKIEDRNIIVVDRTNPRKVRYAIQADTSKWFILRREDKVILSRED
jgi:phage replication O-like protein O